MNAVSLFSVASDACKHCGSTDLSDFATPAWYKKRVVLCAACDKVSVMAGTNQDDGMNLYINHDSKPLEVTERLAI